MRNIHVHQLAKEDNYINFELLFYCWRSFEMEYFGYFDEGGFQIPVKFSFSKKLAESCTIFKGVPENASSLVLYTKQNQPLMALTTPNGFQSDPDITKMRGPQWCN